MNSSMHRRDFIKTTGAVSALPAFGRNAFAAKSAGGRPNILFLNVDQLSIRAIGGFGCAEVKTPNIDRLMQNGYAVRRSYSANPVCGPARSTWQTGRMASEHGVLTNRHDIVPALPDMGQWVRTAGYRTYHTGKWHVVGRPVDKSYYVLADGTRQTGENGDIPVARSVESFLDTYRDHDPFLLVCGLMNPHDICWWLAQHNGTAEVPESMKKDLPPLAFNFGNAEPECEYMKKMRDYNLNARNLKVWSDDMWRFYRWAYYRYVEMVDACIGSIITALEQSSHYRNTLLIFSADHGDTFGAHKGMITKGTLYEESVAVPFICSLPGRIPAGVLDEKTLISGYDLLPTVCDYAGIEPPEHQRGLSLRPLLERGEKPERAAVFSEVWVQGRMVRTERYKYLRYFDSKNEMLFDLDSDPGELVNLAYQPGYEAILEQHRKLQDDFERSLIPCPVWQDEIKQKS